MAQSYNYSTSNNYYNQINATIHDVNVQECAANVATLVHKILPSSFFCYSHNKISGECVPQYSQLNFFCCSVQVCTAGTLYPIHIHPILASNTCIATIIHSHLTHR